ncbi:MAG: class I SAM-dependent methyltransferase [Ferruginibacter sp.]
MIHYNECPVCKNLSINYSFTAKDNTVSYELFEVWKCAQCSLLFTQDIPAEDEIGKYYNSLNYISHSDTKEGFVNQAYHTVRSVALTGKKKLIEKSTGIAAGNILDVGCGTGAFLNTMKKGGWQVTGVEPDEGARQKADSLYSIKPLPSSELFNLNKASFNAITLWHVLEHVHRLHDYIHQIKTLLTARGQLFIALPNHTSTDAMNYKENWAAFDVPRHLYHFSPYSMNILMNLHGLQIKEMKPMWFDSFYVSMLSEKYKNGENNYFNAGISAVASNVNAFINKEKSSSVIYIIEKIS